MFKHRNLIERYVGVCNEALIRNAERFPFKQILGAAQKAECGQSIEVVVEDSPTLETYVFRLKGDGISVKPHSQCKDCDCVRSWNTRIPYLESVTRNPEAYILNPAKLDWEWMYDA